MHRWSGGPDSDWRPWLKGELEKIGCEVFLPEMPDTEVPVIEKWVNYLSQIVGVPDSNTYFIGHSIGCQAILRYLETLDTPIGGAIFVAGWFDLKNLEDEEVKETARPWIETPIDVRKLSTVLPKSTLIISDNDPYDAFEYNQSKFAEIRSKIVIMQDAGHITAESGFIKLPEVLVEFKKY